MSEEGFDKLNPNGLWTSLGRIFKAGFKKLNPNGLEDFTGPEP
jgi:hypothetical protein